MDNNKTWLALIVMAVVISPAYAADVDIDLRYRERNPFNYVSDWSVTIGRGRDERQRIVDRRVDLRAQRRQEHWEKWHKYRHHRGHGWGHDRHDHEYDHR